MTNGWQKLTFKQTKAELMVRIASTLIFNKLVNANAKIVSVREITESVQYGYTDKSSIAEIGPKFVRITDLKDGQVNWETVPYCKCDNPEQYLLKQGDLIFARTGATTGKTHLFRETPPIAVFASYLIRVRPTKEINPEYLYFFFQSDLYWSQISSHKEGSAQPNVNGQKLSNIELPITDEETQKAICKFLAVVRTRQDGITQELPELPQPLNEQRHLLERVEVLATRIANAQSLREEASEEINALSLSAYHRTFQSKNDWQSLKVGDFCDNPQYGYTESAKHEPVGPKFLRITDIQDNRVDWDDVPYCECPQPEKYLLKPKDIVFARTGATTGKSFLVQECPEAVFASYLIRLRILHSVTPEYLYAFFQSPDYWSQITDEKKGTGQPNVNGQKLINVRVPVPPLDEQRRIVAYLDSVQARLASLRELQSATGEELDALLPSVLDKAFKGEL